MVKLWALYCALTLNPNTIQSSECPGQLPQPTVKQLAILPARKHWGLKSVSCKYLHQEKQQIRQNLIFASFYLFSREQFARILLSHPAEPKPQLLNQGPQALQKACVCDVLGLPGPLPSTEHGTPSTIFLKLPSL